MKVLALDLYDTRSQASPTCNGTKVQKFKLQFVHSNISLLYANVATMKRGAELSERKESKSTHKKVKTKSRTAEDFSQKEAETDSDPIVESDTTEQSGEDDGRSWPSDQENKLTGEASDASQSEDGIKSKSPKANAAANDGKKPHQVAIY